MKYLLLPFALLYGAIIAIRNYLYDKNIQKSFSFDMPVIGIGNLSAGGTGKTPMAEYVLQLCAANGYKAVLMSRGYGRQTSGFILADEAATALTIGDEPYQVYRKLPQVHVAVCEDRLDGIRNILAELPETQVIVLDDCYQHRSLKPSFMVLLTGYNAPYYKDFLLPVGMLREWVAGRKRADVIVMTKCPAAIDKPSLIKKLKPLSGQKVFFTGIANGDLINFNTNKTDFPLEKLSTFSILLFSGIANAKPLENYLKSNAKDVKTIDFGDHHRYSANDIQKFITAFKDLNGDKIIITTEKDASRLAGTKEAEMLSGLPLYYLPIAVQWDEKEKAEFDGMILNCLNQEFV